jgi:hypothetical protein
MISEDWMQYVRWPLPALSESAFQAKVLDGKTRSIPQLEVVL